MVTLEHASLTIQGTRILADIDWVLRPGERWVILGPNGAGKTSLMRIASTYQGLTSGRSTILDQPIGAVDVRDLRRQIAQVSAFLEELIHPRTRAVDLVMMGREARLMRWHEEYDETEREAALEVLTRFGCTEVAMSAFSTLSEGERQRVQLARAVATDPELLLLDEPAAGLDLVGREQLLATLARLAATDRPRGVVLVTHHPEEIPAGFTHALLLRGGQVVTSGPIDDTITSAAVSDCFSAPLKVRREDGRFIVRLAA